MSIGDRNLKPGTVLVARYKKQEHRCTVVEGEGGKLIYRLEGGEDYTSPSAAGSAVMKGTACNGWRFWSVEGADEPKARPKAKAKAKSTAKSKSKAKPKAEAKAEKPMTCGECGEEFPNSREAAKHMREEHNSPEAGPGSGN